MSGTYTASTTLPTGTRKCINKPKAVTTSNGQHGTSHLTAQELVADPFSAALLAQNHSKGIDAPTIKSPAYPVASTAFFQSIKSTLGRKNTAEQVSIPEG